MEFDFDISADQHVLIAGPTASGKSGLALQIAAQSGGIIVNADALQVFSNWRVLTARPDDKDLARASHVLYGHIPGHHPYSVGTWLEEVDVLLRSGSRLIIVGGTGLYFRALTEGLANIPEVPASIKLQSETMISNGNLAEMVLELDVATRESIDTANPRRVQRAWEVLKATGRGLIDWQSSTPAPLLPLSGCTPLLIDADRDWLADRIDRRFDMMIKEGALDEARQNLSNWDPAAPSSKAIGAAELISHLQGQMPLDAAIDQAKIATRQYAKRQRTWFRSRMANWHKIVRP